MLHGHHRIKLKERKKTKKLDKIYVYDVYAHVQMTRDQTRTVKHQDHDHESLA